MTTNEALKILEEVTAQVPANRQVHQAIEEALRVLTEAVNREEYIPDQT